MLRSLILMFLLISAGCSANGKSVNASAERDRPSRCVVGERHTPSPAIRKRLDVVVEDSVGEVARALGVGSSEVSDIRVDGIYLVLSSESCDRGSLEIVVDVRALGFDVSHSIVYRSVACGGSGGPCRAGPVAKVAGVPVFGEYRVEGVSVGDVDGDSAADVVYEVEQSWHDEDASGRIVVRGFW